MHVNLVGKKHLENVGKFKLRLPSKAITVFEAMNLLPCSLYLEVFKVF